MRISAYVWVLLFLIIGCSEHKNREKSPTTQSALAESRSISGSTIGHPLGSTERHSNDFDESSKSAAGLQIIYTASMRLITDDFETFPSRLEDLTFKSGGFIAEANVERMQGEFRSGRWTIRVPANTYRDFLHSASDLGIPASVTEKSDDVTTEFVDLRARISGSKKLEEQIVKLLESKNDKIENIIAVERELSRVRVEIERMEGALRSLQDKVALSTISIQASEEAMYVPEQAHNFGERIQIAWNGALDHASDFLQSLSVWAVSNVFVIAGWIVGLIFAWFTILRKVYRKIQLDNQQVS